MNNDLLSVMAIADAYGMRLEFTEHDCSLGLDDLHYAPHPTFVEYQAAHYSDDTQKSLANAKLLLKSRNPTDDEFILAWLAGFKRDPRMGYSKHMYKVLTESNSCDDFRASMNPDKGVTSGAAMAAGIFGLMDDVEKVKSITTQQARITHNTSSGVNAALAIALSVHYLHHGGTRRTLIPFIERHLTPDWNSVANGRTDLPENGLLIATQALDIVSKPGTLMQTLLRAVNYAPKTDTDTICALSIQLAARDQATLNDLPSRLYDMLEQGPYALPYLQSTDRALMTAFPRRPLYGPVAGTHPAPALAGP